MSKNRKFRCAHQNNLFALMILIVYWVIAWILYKMKEQKANFEKPRSIGRWTVIQRESSSIRKAQNIRFYGTNLFQRFQALKLIPEDKRLVQTESGVYHNLQLLFLSYLSLPMGTFTKCFVVQLHLLFLELKEHIPFLLCCMMDYEACSMWGKYVFLVLKSVPC